MEELIISISAGVISILGVIVSSVLTLRGKNEEVSVTRSNELINSQGDRIEALEERLGKMEDQLDTMREEHSEALRVVDALTFALTGAVRTLRAVEVWIDSGAKPPPPVIDVSALERALSDAARPRRPPDNK